MQLKRNKKEKKTAIHIILIFTHFINGIESNLYTTWYEFKALKMYNIFIDYKIVFYIASIKNTNKLATVEAVFETNFHIALIRPLVY